MEQEQEEDSPKVVPGWVFFFCLSRTISLRPGDDVKVVAVGRSEEE